MGLTGCHTGGVAERTEHMETEKEEKWFCCRMQEVAAGQQHVWNASCSVTVATGQPSGGKPSVPQTSRDTLRTAQSQSGGNV